MAILKNDDDDTLCYLQSYHVFGRMPDVSTQTVLTDAAISRVHAALKWDGKDWFISDLNSRNGCWLNGAKIDPAQTHELKLNSKLQFGGPEKTSWTLIDNSQPKPILQALDKNTVSLELDGITIIDPETDAYIRKLEDSSWSLENIEGSRQLTHGELIEVNGLSWKFFNTSLVDETEYTEQDRTPLEQTRFTIEVSQNEEHCKLHVSTNEQNTCLGERTYFYLIYLLAKELHYAHEKKNLDTRSYGWLYTSEIEKLHGINESNLNIFIYRIRKLFEQKLSHISDIARVIERRRGQIRLNISTENMLIDKHNHY